MNVEYWSQEDIAEYSGDTNLLMSKAIELRRKVIRDLVSSKLKKVTSKLK